MIGTETVKGTGGRGARWAENCASACAWAVRGMSQICGFLAGGGVLRLSAIATRVPEPGSASRNPSAVSCSKAASTVPLASCNAPDSTRVEGSRSPAFSSPL
ncbi:hypothetical protein D3C79_888680 [compost metagenome]